jgi:hypothetical protein
MRFRTVLYWIIVTLVIAISQYLYNPSIPVMIAAGLMMLALTILLSWSSTRVGKAMRGGILLTILSIVSGLMFNQGLDVVYSLLAAPEGLRFVMLLEVSAASLVFLVLGLLARVFLARPKIEK